MSFSGNTPVITREQIEYLKEAGLIVLTDRDEQLESYCYVNTPATEPAYLKRCRGIVYDGNKLVLEALPYTEEYPNKIDVLSKALPLDLSTYKVFPSYEGTLLRVFNYEGKWYTTTHRKLDATRSKWGSSKSFGQYFEEALEEACKESFALSELIRDGEGSMVTKFQKNVLDPSRVYLFLLLATHQTRIVCDGALWPTVLHVGTIVNGILVHDDDIKIKRPEVLSVSTLEDLVEWVSESDYTQTQGAIIFGPDNRQYKILNDQYKLYSSVRANVPSIKFRYLQIRTNYDLVEQLKILYPERIPDFNKYEECLEIVAKRIYEAYVNRFIRKQHTVVPQGEFNVMKRCHEWHCANKDTNRISLEKVRAVLSEQTPTSLNHMIKEILYPLVAVNMGLKRIRVE